jgi:hypothetical protein
MSAHTPDDRSEEGGDVPRLVLCRGYCSKNLKDVKHPAKYLFTAFEGCAWHVCEEVRESLMVGDGALPASDFALLSENAQI